MVLCPKWVFFGSWHHPLFGQLEIGAFLFRRRRPRYIPSWPHSGCPATLDGDRASIASSWSCPQSHRYGRSGALFHHPAVASAPRCGRFRCRTAHTSFLVPSGALDDDSDIWQYYFVDQMGYLSKNIITDGKF